MITDKPNTEHGNGTNTVLPAVAPTLTLSTDSTALDGVSGLRGSAIGATLYHNHFQNFKVYQIPKAQQKKAFIFTSC